jgi:hypothetical protein
MKKDAISESGKNKAKQSQFVLLTAENAEYAEMKNICVSDCSIKKYAPYPITPCPLRTRRLMQNKAKQSQLPALFMLSILISMCDDAGYSKDGQQ